MSTAGNFNGTLVTLCGTSITDSVLTDCSVSTSAGEIKITGAGAAEQLFEAGVPVSEISITVIGGDPGPDVGDTGSTTVTWADGTSTDLGTCICLTSDISGSEDGTIESSITAKPTTAA